MEGIILTGPVPLKFDSDRPFYSEVRFRQADKAPFPLKFDSDRPCYSEVRFRQAGLLKVLKEVNSEGPNV